MGFKISSNTFICDSCVQLLETSHSFKKKCIGNYEVTSTEREKDIEVKDETIFTSEDILYETEYIDEDPLMKTDPDEQQMEDEFILEDDDILTDSQFESVIDVAKFDVKTRLTRTTYSPDVKLEAIKFAEQTSNRRASKLLGVDESCIRKWRKISLENLRRVPIEISKVETLKVDVEQLVETQEVEIEECVKTEKIRRKSYSSSQKLEAINYAELVGNRKAAKAFLVDESCIRKWRINKEILIEINQERGLKRKPNLHWPELDAELKSWSTTMLNAGVDLKPSAIKVKSLEIAEKLNLTNFKGTSSYISRFMERYRIGRRKATPVNTK